MMMAGRTSWVPPLPSFLGFNGELLANNPAIFPAAANFWAESEGKYNSAEKDATLLKDNGTTLLILILSWIQAVLRLDRLQ